MYKRLARLPKTARDVCNVCRCRVSNNRFTLREARAVAWLTEPTYRLERGNRRGGKIIRPRFFCRSLAAVAVSLLPRLVRNYQHDHRNDGACSSSGARGEGRAAALAAGGPREIERRRNGERVPGTGCRRDMVLLADRDGSRDALEPQPAVFCRSLSVGR